MTQQSKNGLIFRYDINALRAIAVVGVILYHFNVPFFFGGFSGVDIFFVISGYLMSRIIINSIAKGNFSLLDFYGKRLKRIVPALIFLVIVVNIVSYFIYFPNDYQANEKNATASLLFVSNMFYWANSGYFDPSSDTNLFLHTWSLSVEWQFYMIYPIILLLLFKITSSKSNLLLVFIFTSLVLAIGSILYSKNHSTSSFYFLPSRSWEMMLGGIAFLLEEKASFFKYKKYLVAIAYLALLICIVFLRDAMRWPGYFTLAPTISTFLIIVFNYNRFGFLSNQVLQYFGKISYSLYLWHWPIYVMAYYFGMHHGYLSIFLMIAISIGFGYLSYRYVESSSLNNRTILIAAATLSIFTSAFSFININQSLFNPTSLDLSTYAQTHISDRDRQFDHGGCFLNIKYDVGKKFDIENCIEAKNGQENIVLIGDSHAAHFSQSFKEFLGKRNIHMIQATSSQCFPLITKNGETTCYEMIDYVYNDFIAKNSGKINGVMISANWYRYKGGKEKLLEDLTLTINYLNKLNVKTIVIGQNEIYTIPYPTLVAIQLQYKIKILDKYFVPEAFEMNDYLKKNLPNNYMDIINKDTIPDLSASNVPYLFDENHFTKYGADIAIEKMQSNPIAAGFFGQ